MSAEPLSSSSDPFGDTSGHDTACNCKGCLIDTWHAELEEERKMADALNADVTRLVAKTRPLRMRSTICIATR